MEETKNSYVGAPDTEMKQEYHKKDKDNKGKNKEYRSYEAKTTESKKEEKVEEPKVEAEVEEIPVKEVIKPKKKKGKVILVRKATISVQDENGNNITVRGHRDDVKIGDIVEY